MRFHAEGVILNRSEIRQLIAGYQILVDSCKQCVASLIPPSDCLDRQEIRYQHRMLKRYESMLSRLQKAGL